jgi:hypothetical protein
MLLCGRALGERSGVPLADKVQKVDRH